MPNLRAGNPAHIGLFVVCSRLPTVCGTKVSLLRAFFIWLSESKSIRAMAEKTTIGKRLSSRFVAGLTVEDVLTATKVVNERGQSVSMDNLGENGTNADEAKASSPLYHQLLD